MAPIVALSNPNSLLMTGATVEMLTRSRYVMRYIRLIRKSTNHRLFPARLPRLAMAFPPRMFASNARLIDEPSRTVDHRQAYATEPCVWRDSAASAPNGGGGCPRPPDVPPATRPRAARRRPPRARDRNAASDRTGSPCRIASP